MEECCDVKKTASLTNYYLPYLLKHYGTLEEAQNVGTSSDPESGLFVKIALRTNNDIIIEAKHRCSAEPNVIAGSERVCEMVEGKKLEYAKTVTANDLIEFFPEVPPERQNRLGLAVNALHGALRGS